jgi:translocation and assembly module TamB
VEGHIAAVRGGDREVARAVALRGELVDEVGALRATAALPGLRDPATIEGRARLGARRRTLEIAQLSIAYPGASWELTSPAELTFAGPSVDRLELVAGGQRVAIVGGLRPRGELDARAEVAGIDLARLPAGVLPAGEAIRGTIAAEVSATGTIARPELAATFHVADGAARGLDGLSLVGSARWSGGERRVVGSVAASRRDGGTVEVDADLPVPLSRRAGERLLLRVRGRDLPLEELLAALGSAEPAAGVLGVDAVLEGTPGAPSLSLSATVADGEWRDLDGLAVDLACEGGGGRLRVSAHGAVSASGEIALDAEVPLELAAVLERPAPALRALRAAPLEGNVSAKAIELRALAGRLGLPDGLSGVVDARAAVSGTLAAPRATAALDLARASVAGWRDLGAHVDVVLGDEQVSVGGRLHGGGADAARFQAALRAPVERLRSLDAIAAAPLAAEVIVPRFALAPAAPPDLALAGTLDGRLAATGTLRRPVLDAALTGEAITIDSRPLGAGRLVARYAAGRAAAELELSASAGGTLRANLTTAGEVGLGVPPERLAEAPSELTASAQALDLGFLAAAAPGVVRSAGGTLSLELRASGPLARLAPRGSLRVNDGKLAVSELGEWTGIAVDAEVTEDAVELRQLEVHRGGGKLSAGGSLRGLRKGKAALEARLAADAFTVTRAGQDLATLDLRADVRGSYEAGTLAVDVHVPRGVIRLPKRSPRSLQPLEARGDIVVGRRAERRRRARAAQETATVAAAATAPVRPFTVTTRVRVDRNLFVKSDDPKVDLELRADVEWERAGSEQYAQGFVEVIRGTVEPVGGRTFVVERGRVQFTGGPPTAAMLDVEAKYNNPAAIVTVKVQGPATKPQIELESQPQMDDAQIAMLIATGRTEIKAGGGGVEMKGEAGKAALALLATQVFKDLVADKLPLDSVALEAGGVRAGKYLTDKIYVIYVRRFEADPLRGENVDEVRVEYQITPRWMFESRYGNAQAGGASLIWSKEY